MNIIDLFSRPDVSEICKLSLEGTTFISEDDIVKYMMNHLE
jgi:hypothetical protein